MSYKNTMKLLASNFMLVWKQVLYLLICFMFAILCVYTTAQPIVSLLREHNIIYEIKMIVETVYNSPSDFALQLSEVLKHLINVVFSNFSNIWVSLFGFFILGIFVPYILIQMSFYNISSILYQSLSMNMQVNYVQNGVQQLKQSFKYAIANIIFNLPFLAIVILLIEIYLLLANSTFTAILGLFILSALLIITLSINLSLFTCYFGYMIENNSGPIVSFAKSIITTLKNFWKILSPSVIIVLTVIFVNGFIALFTFFSGLIVTIPATFVLIAIYNLVTYFNVKGERYYLTKNMIFNPTKYVVKQDNFTGTDIPEEIKEIEVTTVKMKKKRVPKENKPKKKTKSKSKSKIIKIKKD